MIAVAVRVSLSAAVDLKFVGYFEFGATKKDYNHGFGM